MGKLKRFTITTILFCTAKQSFLSVQRVVSIVLWSYITIYSAKDTNETHIFLYLSIRVVV